MMTNNASSADVRALLDTRAEACKAKDIDRVMALYSPDIVYYDAVPPIQFDGSDEVRNNFLRFFASFDGPIDLDAQDPAVTVGGDVAFAHMLHQVSGERDNGVGATMEVRSTVCCQRSGEKWMITHEHVSVPIDPSFS